MTAFSANPAVVTKTQRRGTTKTFVVQTSEIIYDGSLVGIDSNGDLKAWADSASLKFVGIVEGAAPTTGNDAATPAVRVTVRIDGPILVGVDVANVTDRNSIGAFVYCTTDNPADLTTTATTNVKAIGRLIDWRSNSDMDVLLLTTAEHLNVPLTADLTGLTDSSGYSGSHDDTVAAMTAITALTDNTGLSGTHDDTLAATSVPASLTENSTTIGGTQNSNFSTLATAWDGSTYPTAAESALLIDGIRECAGKINVILTLLGVMVQNASDTAQKVNELNTREVIHAQNLSDIAQKVIEITTALNIN